MRSQSRILLENPERYNQLLAKSDMDKKLLNDIRAQKTSIGLQKLDNPAVNAALAGEAGTVRYQEYHGKETLSSYAPIQVLNNNWALISEIDYQEAVNAATNLSEKLTYTTIVTAAILIGASIIAAIIFARSIVSPITQTVNVMHNIAAVSYTHLTLPTTLRVNTTVPAGRFQKTTPPATAVSLSRKRSRRRTRHDPTHSATQSTDIQSTHTHRNT